MSNRNSVVVSRRLLAARLEDGAKLGDVTSSWRKVQSMRQVEVEVIRVTDISVFGLEWETCYLYRFIHFNIYMSLKRSTHLHITHKTTSYTVLKTSLVYGGLMMTQDKNLRDWQSHSLGTLNVWTYKTPDSLCSNNLFRFLRCCLQLPFQQERNPQEVKQQ